jgi:hypothetical protein
LRGINLAATTYNLRHVIEILSFFFLIHFISGIDRVVSTMQASTDPSVFKREQVVEDPATSSSKKPKTVSTQDVLPLTKVAFLGGLSSYSHQVPYT